MTQIKPFTYKYKWEGINFLSEKDDWKKFEKNNMTIVLNVLNEKKEKIYAPYVSKIIPTVKSTLFFKRFTMKKSAKLSLKKYDSIILQ